MRSQRIHPMTRREFPHLRGAVLGLTLVATVAEARAGASQGPPPVAGKGSAAAGVPGAIEKTLQKHGPELHRCFEKALADRLDVAGRIEVEVDVGAGGRVSKARVLTQGRDVPPALTTCVQTSAAGWTIDGIEPGAAVVLPIAFQSQANQFVVKAADVPDRGPAAPKARGGTKAQAPFTVKVLADPVNVRAQQVSLTRLTVGPASRVAMHRHPRSAKVLYLVKGHARVLGPTGTPPFKLDEGTALFLPPGYPHVIENMGRQADAVFLQAFSPPGPERVYRDPADPAGRADFEVVRDPRVKAPEGTPPVAVEAAKVDPVDVLGGKGKARVLLDQKTTGSPALALTVLELQPGAELPRQTDASAASLLYVVAGGGEVTVGSEKTAIEAESTVHIPAGQPAGAKATVGPTVIVQIHGPAGPEQRYRSAGPQKPPAK